MTYLTIDEAIEIHDEVIRISGGLGGYHQALGYLTSALESIQNDGFYPSFGEKIAHLMFACIKFHPFIDGNKRTSIALAMTFLYLNDVEIEGFGQMMEDTVVQVAEGIITKDGLLEILENFILRN